VRLQAGHLSHLKQVEICVKFKSEILSRKRERGADKKTIIKYILEQYGMMSLTGFFWFQISVGTSGEFFKWVNKLLVSISGGQFPDLLSDYQFLKTRG
jgi:hypothetical protein